MANYTVHAHRVGGPTVAFECAHCHAPLESPLEEAGQSFPCPTCGASVQTPGTEELRKHRLAKEQQRIELAKRKEAERALKELTEARRAAELKTQIAKERAAAYVPTERQWRIRGVWRDTGDHVELVIDSQTATNAEATASGRGVTVTSCDPVIPLPTAQAVASAGNGWSGRSGKNDIVCPNPNCGYRGPGKKKSKASLLVMIFLLLWMIVPGILYGLLCGGEILICPRCGAKARDA